MPTRCAAVGCSEIGRKGTELSFHHFPKDENRRREWIVRMNRRESATSQKLWQPKLHDVLCSKHFERSCFTDTTLLSSSLGLNYKPELKPDAVPTIFEHRKRPQCTIRSVHSKRRKRELVTELLGESSTTTTSTTEVLCDTPRDKDSDAEDAEQLEISTSSHNKQAAPITSTVKVQTVHIRLCTRETQTDPPAPQSSSRDNFTEPHCSNTNEKGCQTEPFWSGVKEEESEEAESEGAQDSSSDSDTDWKEARHPQDRTLTEDLNTVNPFSERKYIVFESKLLELINQCRACSKPCKIQKEECGTSVQFVCHCVCGKKLFWTSQPHSYKLPLGNLVLAAAAFFTACSPTRLISAFQHANVAVFGRKTYNNIQTAYLVPSVRNVWQRCQDHLFSARRGKGIKLAGDGRCDSPGHSAKYGSYTLMDAETSEVLHIELVQSNQVTSSHAMELKGLKDGLQKVKQQVQISHLITDRHASIKKYMRDHESPKGDDQLGITHHFDIWHMAKGVGKTIDAAAKSKANESLAEWAKSIKNHMYWCSVSSPEGPDRVEIVKQKWTSIINHVSDIHTGHGEKFPKCKHGALAPRTWIKKDSRQHRILDKIVRNPFLLRDVGMLSPDVQTSALESYHAVVCHFAPKLNHFTHPVMQAKLYLAAIHFNANADRKQATTVGGELRWKVDRPRASKGVPVAKMVKEAATRDYIPDLYEEVLLLRVTYPSYKRAKEAQQNFLWTVPETLSKTAGDVDKAAVIAQHRSRFTE